MDWPPDGATIMLVIVRAIHFAATGIMAGTLLVGAVVAEPALRPSDHAARVVRAQTLRVAWTSLVIAILSGGAWVALQAHAMSGLPFADAVTPDILRTVLNETRFGQATEIRAVLAILLSSCLIYDRNRWARWPALGAALGLLAALAWTGHAGAEPGATASLHLAADVFHLLGAGAWIGGLVPLVMVLIASQHSPAIARDVTMRFSTLGVISVGTLIVTGLVNAWILVGTPRALLATDYGRLLLIKLGLFALMLTLAAFNRQVLRPRLTIAALGDEPQLIIVRQLTRNSVIEIALGLGIFAVVGVLGILHPAIHFVSELERHGLTVVGEPQEAYFTL